MSPDHERELRDLLRHLTYRKRLSYQPRERYVVLKRWGSVSPPTFAEFRDALSFANGYIDGSNESDACAFVVDTDPEYATANLVSRVDRVSIVDLKDEIKALYDGLFVGEGYAENLIEQRKADRTLAAKIESEQRQGTNLLFAMIIAGVLLFIFLFK